ncbi:MAG: phospholipase A [Cognaticolwellia sp.]|jgi:phospholipase A1
MKRIISLVILSPAAAIISFFVSPAVNAASNSSLDSCLLATLKSAGNDITAEQIRQRCEDVDTPDTVKKGVISKRITAEQQTAFDPYVITPHKMNYILPISISDGINRDAYDSFGDWSDNIVNSESKFQLSIKVPLNYNSMLVDGDGLYFGFTMQSWWQIYSENISKPFRETNYQPEFFYLAPLKWHPAGGNTGFMLGLEHQSNGRGELLSRSWNRLYFNLLYEKDNFALSFKPWWRLPEDKKESIDATDGDDNPDIADFMGHFELGMVYKWDEYELNFIGRENFATHHGGMELGLTFPLWGKLRGYLQYTNGYGESLIDYNYSQQRIGIGIALTNAL